MAEEHKIVSMIEWNGKVILATPHTVYQIDDKGNWTPIFTQDDMRKCDEEWDRKHNKCNECDGVGMHTGECIFYGQR